MLVSGVNLKGAPPPEASSPAAGINLSSSPNWSKVRGRHILLFFGPSAASIMRRALLRKRSAKDIGFFGWARVTLTAFFTPAPDFANFGVRNVARLTVALRGLFAFITLRGFLTGDTDSIGSQNSVSCA
jgi:hypothetical protein